ncbi:MAG TPA: lipid II flippase Amj family protein [Bacillus sp. (in: firmicutes)]|uniref:lipid II flippase Amj family protein n=1 Tax=Bacillus litorisediminis TaxID=2922713 RepID=UPI001FAF4831|nr:lipid II flippase Amj family protein [Bacillus litorisediminis]HWO76558.1 lipid II flippase Amj family protein [Bacillus sp. (in: firmicutes)]
MEFITEKLVFIALFIFIIHCIETLAYAVRLSGARVKMIASALSLFNLMVIVSRLANMLQQPFTGSLIDTAPQENTLSFVESQYRFLIGSSSVGTLLGIVLLPTFIALFSRAIIHLSETRGSVPNLIKKGLSFEFLKRGIKHAQLPRISYLKDVSLKDVPIKLFIINMVITAIYTIGVLSALYAALIAPERSSTAIMASGLINGVATILLVVFIDPKISVLADDVVNKRGSYIALKGVSLMLVTSRLLGTLFAQILFIPGAHYVAWFTKFIV